MNTLQKIVTIGAMSMAFITGCARDEYLREYSGKKDQKNVILKGTATTRLMTRDNEDNLFDFKTLNGDDFVVKNNFRIGLGDYTLSEEAGSVLSKAINGKDTLTVFGDIRDSSVYASFVLYKDKLLGVYK